mgnify:CR=1 FL=1
MIKKLNLKLFIENPEALDVEAVIPVFHGWIRDNLLEGLPIDVADYKHVPNGPGLMLIGHDGDYAIDFANGRSGLWYSHKREWEATDLQGQIRLAWERLIHAAQLLENDPTLDIRFSTAEIELTLADRLNAPNNATTFALVRDDVQALLSELFNATPVGLAWANEDTRRPFSVQATINHAPALAELGTSKVAA